MDGQAHPKKQDPCAGVTSFGRPRRLAGRVRPCARASALSGTQTTPDDRVRGREESDSPPTPTPTPTPETALGFDGQNLDNTPLESPLTPLTHTPNTPAVTVGGERYTIAELTTKLGKSRQSIEGYRKKETLYKLGYRAEQLNSKWFYYSI